MSWPLKMFVRSLSTRARSMWAVCVCVFVCVWICVCVCVCVWWRQKETRRECMRTCVYTHICIFSLSLIPYVYVLYYCPAPQLSFHTLVLFLSLLALLLDDLMPHLTSTWSRLRWSSHARCTGRMQDGRAHLRAMTITGLSHFLFAQFSLTSNEKEKVWCSYFIFVCIKT